jgi:phage terminase large subunit
MRAGDKIIASGNTDRGPVGEFFKVSKLWPSVSMSALDHPNVVEGRAVIPGGPSAESIALLAAQYGVDSPFYVASVLGEFPKDAQHSLFLAEWIDDAVALFNRGAWHHTMRRRLRFGIDVARFGADKTVVCVLQGQVVTDFVTWGGVPLDETVARITEVVSRFGVRPVEPVNYAAEASLYYGGLDRLAESQPGDPLERQAHSRDALLRFDTVGVGGGPHDEMRARRFPVESFVSGEKPTGERAERFFNRRAQAFWELREALEKGELALPPAHREQLVRELTAISYAPNADRKIQIEAKAAIKVKLSGASPDYADALAMAHCSDGVLDFTTTLSEWGEAVVF